MPEGSGIHSTMPRPFYGQWRSVARGRAHEESINEQIAKITDASATNRYKVEVMPGIYPEAVTMQAFVDVAAPYGQVIIRPPAAATTGVTMASNSMLQGVTVDMVNAGAGSTGVVVGALTNMLVEDCYITGGAAGDIGISDASAGTTVTIRRCVVDLHATGYQKTAGGTTTIQRSQFTAASGGIDLDLNAGNLTLSYTQLLGDAANVDVAAAAIVVTSRHNTLYGTGWLIGANAGAVVLSYADNYPTVAFAGALGSFVDLTGCKLFTCLAGVAVGEWVYVSGVVTVAEAQANALATMPAIGVVVYKPTATSCYVKQSGYYYDSAAPFVTSSTYWISDTVAGAITAVMPGIWPQQAGEAISTVCLKVLLGTNQGLANTNVYNNAGGAVAANNWVYITAVNHEVAPARADAAATMPAIGVVVEVITATTCRVRTGGKHSQATLAFAASQDLYISSAVAGALTNVAPVGGIVQKVAEVKSDDGVNTIMELA